MNENTNVLLHDFEKSGLLKSGTDISHLSYPEKYTIDDGLGILIGALDRLAAVIEQQELSWEMNKKFPLIMAAIKILRGCVTGNDKLRGVLDYCKRRLLEAKNKKKALYVTEVATILRSLRMAQKAGLLNPFANLLDLYHQRLREAGVKTNSSYAEGVAIVLEALRKNNSAGKTALAQFDNDFESILEAK